MKKNTVKDRIFILTATAAFVFLMCLTGYFKMEKSKPFSYKDNLKKEAAVINGKGLTLKDMAYGEYMDFDKAPASKDVLFDILENHARLATQSRTFNQDWFNEFN